MKSVSEMAWMDYCVRGMGEKSQWRQVLDTLEEPRPAQVTAEAGAVG